MCDFIITLFVPSNSLLIRMFVKSAPIRGSWGFTHFHIVLLRFPLYPYPAPLSHTPFPDIPTHKPCPQIAVNVEEDIFESHVCKSECYVKHSKVEQELAWLETQLRRHRDWMFYRNNYFGYKMRTTLNIILTGKITYDYFNLNTGFINFVLININDTPLVNYRKVPKQNKWQILLFYKIFTRLLTFLFIFQTIFAALLIS